MGEKFAVNPVTCTGSMTVPIATSLGRSGFGPKLVLFHGSGPFSLAWDRSLPLITRKPDKRLPQYRNVDKSDSFILSGSKELVSFTSLNGRQI